MSSFLEAQSNNQKSDKTKTHNFDRALHEIDFMSRQNSQGKATIIVFLN